MYTDQLRITAELDEEGHLIKRFVYERDANVPDYMIFGGERYFFVKDSRGSVVKVVNSKDGEVVQEMDYNSWGKVVRDTNPGFQPFGFAGGLYDNSTKLVHFGAREYDAETGRWLTKDPILFSGGDTNLYGYVLQDPVNFIDPMGLWGFSCGGAMLGLGLAGGTAGGVGGFLGWGPVGAAIGGLGGFTLGVGAGIYGCNPPKNPPGNSCMPDKGNSYAGK